MYIGCDQVYTSFMSGLGALFEQCRAVQVRRSLVLKESADLAQVYREIQLQNVMSMEGLDGQVDEALSLRQRIEALKRDLLTVRSRQLTYLKELFDLYKSKDRELDFLSL
jgi:hypothetical protein